MLLALAGVWGSSFLFIKVIVDEASPAELVAGRLVLGAAAMLAFIAVRRRRVEWSPALLGKTSIMAVVNNIIPFMLISWGEQHINSGTASVLNSTVPIFTAAFAAAVFADEYFTPSRAAGLMLGLLGVVALTGDDVLHVTDSSVLGQLAVIAASACYGAGSVYARTLLHSHDPVDMSVAQLIMASVMAVPLMFLLEGTPDYSLSLEATLSLLTLGIAGTGLAYMAYLWLIGATGAVRASLVTYIIPVTALFLGSAVLDENIGWNTVAGAALIIVGVASVMRGQAPSPRAEETPVIVD